MTLSHYEAIKTIFLDSVCILGSGSASVMMSPLLSCVVLQFPHYPLCAHSAHLGPLKESQANDLHDFVMLSIFKLIILFPGWPTFFSMVLSFLRVNIIKAT